MKDLEEKKGRVNDPTAYVCAALRRVAGNEAVLTLGQHNPPEVEDFVDLAVCVFDLHTLWYEVEETGKNEPALVSVWIYMDLYGFV